MGHRSPRAEVSRQGRAQSSLQTSCCTSLRTDWRNDVVCRYQVREVSGALEAGGMLGRPHLLCETLRNDVPLRMVHGTQTGEKEASIIHENWLGNSPQPGRHWGGTDLSHLIHQKCSYTWERAVSVRDHSALGMTYPTPGLLPLRKAGVGEGETRGPGKLTSGMTQLSPVWWAGFPLDGQ